MLNAKRIQNLEQIFDNGTYLLHIKYDNRWPLDINISIVKIAPHQPIAESGLNELIIVMK